MREGDLASKAKRCLEQETATLYEYILCVNSWEKQTNKQTTLLADNAGIGRNAPTDCEKLTLETGRTLLAL